MCVGADAREGESDRERGDSAREGEREREREREGLNQDGRVGGCLQEALNFLSFIN